MTIEQDFLPFACAGGANVLSQSAYLGLGALGPGFSAGIAPSIACNKVWRQSSIMAAVLGDFIVAQTGQTVIDDGTTATILTNLESAVEACVTPTITSAISAAIIGTVTATGTAKLTSGALAGLTIKWGSLTAGSTSGNQAFGTSFPTTCLVVIACTTTAAGGFFSCDAGVAASFNWTLGGTSTSAGYYIAIGH